MDSKEDYMHGTELATFFSSAHFNESAFELFELVVLENFVNALSLYSYRQKYLYVIFCTNFWF